MNILSINKGMNSSTALTSITVGTCFDKGLIPVGDKLFIQTSDDLVRYPIYSTSLPELGKQCQILLSSRFLLVWNDVRMFFSTNFAIISHGSEKEFHKCKKTQW